MPNRLWESQRFSVSPLTARAKRGVVERNDEVNDNEEAMWSTDKDAELLLFMFASGLGAGGAIFKEHCLSHKDGCNARLEAVKSFQRHRLHQSGRNVRLKIVKPCEAFGFRCTPELCVIFMAREA
jgi:hypothetical protein